MGARRILLATTGTRGDVQPLVALGRELARRGHEITVAAPDDARPLVEAHGLAFRSAGVDFEALSRSARGRDWLESGASPLAYARHVRELFVPLQTRGCEAADAAVEGMDALVYYPLAAHFLHAAERRRLPVVATPFVPWIPSGEIAPLFMPSLRARWLRRALGHLTHRAFWSPFMASHRAYRARVGLPSVRAPDLSHHAFELRVPHVHLYSEALSPRPDDWPAWATIGGRCALPADGYEPPAELARFLEQGPKPVYVGFGSMTGHHAEAHGATLLDALERAGLRAIVATGWGGLAISRPPDSVHVVADVPHAWLFPRVAAVVHHGGVGTFSAGLAAGRPTLMIPFFGDQPFWARRAAELGVGPPAIPRRELDARRLAEGIRRAVGEPSYAERAAEIARRMAQEAGCARAADQVLAGLGFAP